MGKLNVANRTLAIIGHLAILRRWNNGRVDLIAIILGIVFTGSACAGTTCALDGLGEGIGQPGQHPSEWVVDWTPRWSIDSQYVVASIKREPTAGNGVGVPGVYVASVVDASIRRISIESDGVQSSPRIYRDGRIIFTDYVHRSRSGFVEEGYSPHHWKIGIANADGTLLSQIPFPQAAPEKLNVFYPALIPETDRIIALVSYQVDYEEGGIHEVSANGDLQRLDFIKDWFYGQYGFEVSPDGKHIAYYRRVAINGNGRGGLQPTVVRVDGQGEPIHGPTITSNEGASPIAWSSDASQIFFAVWVGSFCGDIKSTRIFAMNADQPQVELIAEPPPTGCDQSSHHQTATSSRS